MTSIQILTARVTQAKSLIKSTIIFLPARTMDKSMVRTGCSMPSKIALHRQTIRTSIRLSSVLGQPPITEEEIT
jgi:hypothetical protein